MCKLVQASPFGYTDIRISDIVRAVTIGYPAFSSTAGRQSSATRL